jgi:hypothetical protein
VGHPALSGRPRIPHGRGVRIEESWWMFKSESMVGGTTFPLRVIQRETSRALVLNLWRTIRCSKHRQEKFVLDTAFALIEGQPLLWRRKSGPAPAHSLAPGITTR